MSAECARLAVDLERLLPKVDADDLDEDRRVAFAQAALAKIAALAPVIVLVNVTWLAFGSLFSRWLSHPVLGRAVNVIFAVLLVASVAAAIL